MRQRAIVALMVSLELTARGVSEQQSQAASSAYWLDIQLKARSVLVDPAAPTALHQVMDPLPEPLGVRSPDGRKAAYIGSDPQRVKDGHDFDLFVADVDASQPAGKANGRRLTTDQQRPTTPQWLADSSGIVFVAGDNPSLQVWHIDLGEGSQPVRLSDGQHRCYDVSILADARVAWIVHKGSKNKQQFKDLVLHPSLLVKGHMQTLLTDQHISSYAIGPDAKTLAWSGLGSLFLVNLETSESREIPLHGVHRQLINHTAHQIAWRPDGQVLAIHCGFLGGIAVQAGQEFPRMFAADKVFFVPVNWSPAPESLKVGEGDAYPSPTANDPDAEVSHPAGDESKPWWVREVPEHVNALTWVSAEDAKRRIAKHPAPPEVQPKPPQRRVTPLPGNEPRP
jgi:hypothetical protein